MVGGGEGGGADEVRKNLLFVNKKKQKNFIHWHPALPGEADENG
jgi:hypothetical protein